MKPLKKKLTKNEMRVKKHAKAKYSKTYTKLQLQKMEECTQYFINEIQKLKQNG